jgi:hypothetical protein
MHEVQPSDILYFQNRTPIINTVEAWTPQKRQGHHSKKFVRFLAHYPRPPFLLC